jgi:hypothetical protein
MIKNSILGESARASLRDPILKEFWVSLLSSCEIENASGIMLSFINPMSENINGIKAYPLIKSKIREMNADIDKQKVIAKTRYLTEMSLLAKTRREPWDLLNSSFFNPMSHLIDNSLSYSVTSSLRIPLRNTIRTSIKEGVINSSNSLIKNLNK